MPDVYGLSERAADGLERLLNQFDTGARPSGRAAGSGRIQMVKCLSATAAGATGVLSECYPAQIVSPAGDKKLPAETGGLVLLTVIGSDGNPATPVANQTYLCVVAGDAAGDESGSGSAVVAGRPRAFGIASSSGGTGDVVGPSSATNTAMALFDGTTGKLIKNSVYTVGATGLIANTTNAQDGWPVLWMGAGFVAVRANDVLTGTLLTDYAQLTAGGTGTGGPGITFSHCGGFIMSIRDYLGEFRADVSNGGAFIVTSTNGSTTTCKYSIVRYSGFVSQRSDGIDTTFQVTQSGVTKTVSVVGGIVVGIS